MTFILTVVCVLILLWEGFKIFSASKIREYIKDMSDANKLNKEEQEARVKKLMTEQPMYFVFLFMEMGYMLTALLLLLSPLYMIGVLLLSLSLFNFIVGKLLKITVKPTWYYVLDSFISIIIVVAVYQSVLG